MVDVFSLIFNSCFFSIVLFLIYSSVQNKSLTLDYSNAEETFGYNRVTNMTSWKKTGKISD